MVVYGRTGRYDGTQSYGETFRPVELSSGSTLRREKERDKGVIGSGVIGELSGPVTCNVEVISEGGAGEITSATHYTNRLSPLGFPSFVCPV